MILVVLLGALSGGAVFVAWRSTFPPEPALVEGLARFRRQAPKAGPRPGPVGWKGPAGRWGRSLLTSVGVDVESAVRSDLHLLNRSPEEHVAEKVLAVAAGGLLPLAWVSAIGLAGVSFPKPVAVAASLGLVVGGFFLPDLTLRREAVKRRRDFRVALSSCLDLIVIDLAGGAGIEGALADAGRIGNGPVFDALAEALRLGDLNGESPWDALGRLGERIGISELVELASTLALAGTEGSRVRASLVAKAAAMRDHELAEAEARAQSATERMALPTVMLTAGFLLLVGYPAVRAVMVGL